MVDCGMGLERQMLCSCAEMADGGGCGACRPRVSRRQQWQQRGVAAARGGSSGQRWQSASQRASQRGRRAGLAGEHFSVRRRRELCYVRTARMQNNVCRCTACVRTERGAAVATMRTATRKCSRSPARRSERGRPSSERSGQSGAGRRRIRGRKAGGRGIGRAARVADRTGPVAVGGARRGGATVGRWGTGDGGRCATGLEGSEEWGEGHEGAGGSSGRGATRERTHEKATETAQGRGGGSVAEEGELAGDRAGGCAGVARSARVGGGGGAAWAGWR